VRSLFCSAGDIALSVWISNSIFYGQIAQVGYSTYEKLGLYEEGYPVLLKRINSTTLEIIKSVLQLCH